MKKHLSVHLPFSSIKYINLWKNMPPTMSKTTAMGSSPPQSSRSEFNKLIYNDILSAISPSQVEFILPIRNIDPIMIGDLPHELITRFFPPSYHFGTGILALPSSDLELLERLDSRGVNLPQHASRSVLHILSNNTFMNLEYQDYAIQKTLLIRSELTASSKECSDPRSHASEPISLPSERIAQCG